MSNTIPVQKLHLGCGLTRPAGWINLDGSWNAWLAKHPLMRRIVAAFRLVPRSQLEIEWGSDVLIHDVRKPLPFPDHSIAAIYSSHLLEHLFLEEAERLLKECRRVLQPNGVLRIVVPDLRSIVLEYLGQSALDSPPLPNSEMLSPADRMNMRLLLRSPRPQSGWMLYRLYSALKDFHWHKWMYDAPSLMTHFRDAGFVDVAQKGYHDSRIDDIAVIEQASRVLDGKGICIEGVNPA
jgi:predicted SAM-dependent methyltransferase